MKQISAELKAHIQEELTSLVTCWVLTRRDGVRMAFTTHDKPIEFDNLTFSPTNSFLPSMVGSSNGLNVDNLEVHSFLSSDGITEKDIRAGLFDHSIISIFQVNWQDLSQGKISIRHGWLGEFIVKDKNFTVEIRGLTQKLQQNIGHVFSPECRADLGAQDCYVNLAQFTEKGTVTEVASPDSFKDNTRNEQVGWYDYGMVRWVIGANAGIKAEVKNFTAGQFVLFDDLPEPVSVGDVYICITGCDKRATTCKVKFQNFDNFKGETAIPGTDSLYSYPSLK